VLSNRTTGDTGTNFIQVADSGGSLTEQTGKAKEGQNAIFSVDGVQGTSTSNTVTSAIAGVSLNLTGVTTTSGPVTVNVAAPAPDPTAVTAAVKQFVTDYNSSISLISTQLTTVPVDNPTTQADASVGTLYGDTDLNSLLNNMRQQMYNPLAGLASDMNSLSEIGISTGAATGYATPTASSLAGTLQLDPDKLAAALTANPQGVEGVLRSFSFQFGTTVDGEAQPGGTLDSRISADNSQISDYGNQITQMNASLTLQQQSLTNEYAQLESTLSLSESQGSELSSEIAELG
jgi:flagellar hook-associated protein 2